MEKIITVIVIFVVIVLFMVGIWGLNKYRYKEKYDLIEVDLKEFPIYVISLPQSKDRREYIKRELEGYSYEIIDAVNGKMINDNDLPQYIKRGSLRPGQIGCFMSHVNLWKRLNESNQKSPCIVLEDDAQIAINLEEIKRLPNDYDIIFLGHCAEEETEKVFNAGNGIEMQKSVYPRCTHGYIISERGAWKLSELIQAEEHDLPIDEELAKLILHGKLTCFSTYPTVVNAGAFESTINTN